MMIIIATLQFDGFFSLIARKTISWSGTRIRLLTIIVFVTGIASAFLVNDADVTRIDISSVFNGLVIN